MKRDMSEIQANILNFIEEYTRREGRPPTNREIGHKVGILSTGHVDYHLTVLARKGYIVRLPRKSRGIKLASQGLPGPRVQGTIAAGSPIEIYPEADQEVFDFGAHTREYVLQVRGKSMIEDCINDGDFVLIEPAETASNGDIIVATCKTSNSGNGSATLKRFYKESDGVRLQPANSEMEPIRISKQEWDDDWIIQGKVKAVYRRFE